jgi:hypothetical protein
VDQADLDIHRAGGILNQDKLKQYAIYQLVFHVLVYLITIDSSHAGYEFDQWGYPSDKKSKEYES